MRGRIELRKALLTVVFAAIAMVSGDMVSVGGMNEVAFSCDAQAMTKWLKDDF